MKTSFVLALAFATTASSSHVPSWVKTDGQHRLGELRSRRLSFTAGTMANANSFDATGCSATVADGGWGFCGPASCKDDYITCATLDGGGPQTVDGVAGTWAPAAGSNGASCKSFLPRDEITMDADLTTSDMDVKGACTACTQQTTGVCSSEFLAAVFTKHDGVKAAYCNDKWLVVGATGEYDPALSNLNDIPYPPAKDGTSYVTGESSILFTKPSELYYPLGTTDLSAATSNNLAVYDTQTGAGPYSFLKDTSNGMTYGLPSDGALGMTVNGMPIFPVYNNQAKYTPQKCEVDRCNLHVGQGGGVPHFHGDFFGDEAETTCLYGPSDYASGAAGHPPVVGFSYDGHLIYGRYLSDAAPGFAAPLLDACGGHAHAEAGTDEHGNSLQDYHYHAQIFDATVESGQTATTGQAYIVSTPGPFQCFKADLTSVEGSSALLVATASATYKSKTEMGYHCCGMTDYYLYNGVSPGGGAAATNLASSSMCTVPANPLHGDYSTYDAGERACTAGATIYSGNACIPQCDANYEASGMTRCVGGVIAETATCVAIASPSTSPVPVPVSVPVPAPTKAPTAASVPGSVSEVFKVQLAKSPSGMFYYPLQGLLYVLCGTSTNGDHYLYTLSLSGAQQCLITIPQAVGMSRVDGFTINAAGTKAYIADSQGPIYADTMLGGSIYELTWDNPCGCTSAGTCANTAVSWTPTITNTIVLDALDPAIGDGGGADDYYRNSGVLLSADELSVFGVDGVHPIGAPPGSLTSSYPKSLLKISLADGSVEQRWSFTAATLGHDVDMEALTCGPDACAEFLYIGDEWNYIYQMRLAEADPSTAIVQEWDLSAIVDSTDFGTINSDKGIESLTYSATTGYFYVGIQDSSYLHAVTLSGAVDVLSVSTLAPTTVAVPVPSPTTAPIPSPTRAPIVAPTKADTTTVDVSLSITGASAAPTEDEEATLKTEISESTGVNEADLHNFAVTSTSSRRRRLASYTWLVTFEVVASLASAGVASADDLRATIVADLTSPAFASAVSGAISGVAVDTSSVSAAVTPRHAPTSMPVVDSPPESVPEEVDDDGASAAAAVNIAVGVVIGLLALCIGGLLVVKYGYPDTWSRMWDRMKDDDLDDSNPKFKEAELVTNKISKMSASSSSLNGDI